MWRYEINDSRISIFHGDIEVTSCNFQHCVNVKTSMMRWVCQCIQWLLVEFCNHEDDIVMFAPLLMRAISEYKQELVKLNPNEIGDSGFAFTAGRVISDDKENAKSTCVKKRSGYFPYVEDDYFGTFVIKGSGNKWIVTPTGVRAFVEM